MAGSWPARIWSARQIRTTQNSAAPIAATGTPFGRSVVVVAVIVITSATVSAVVVVPIVVVVVTSIVIAIVAATAVTAVVLVVEVVVTAVVDDGCRWWRRRGRWSGGGCRHYGGWCRNAHGSPHDLGPDLGLWSGGRLSRRGFVAASSKCDSGERAEREQGASGGETCPVQCHAPKIGTWLTSPGQAMVRSW
jgi:hypothetical protein